jgi:hypothetical protein
MSHFMLLLHENPEMWGKLSPEEMQKAIEKYYAWTKLPIVADSKRLAAEPGKVLRSSGGQTQLSDGPYSETKEVLGGYYTIEAADYQEAIARAMGHPHLEYGGTIEVRETWKPS